MRNIWLVLLLANLLLFAWNRWVVPLPRAAVLELPGALDQPAPLAPAATLPPTTVAAAPSPVTDAPTTVGDTCVQVGPLPEAGAAAELGRSLAASRLPGVVIAREAQVWVGNWIQVSGFDSPAAAAAARDRLVAGGLADAYLMQEAAEPVISLGVFRDKGGADRVAAIARGLGFEPISTNRYRPGVEYWLLLRVPATGIGPGDGLPKSGSLTVAPAECPGPDTEAGRALAAAIAAAADPAVAPLNEGAPESPALPATDPRAPGPY